MPAPGFHWIGVMMIMSDETGEKATAPGGEPTVPESKPHDSAKLADAGEAPAKPAEHARWKSVSSEVSDAAESRHGRSRKPSTPRRLSNARPPWSRRPPSRLRAAPRRTVAAPEPKAADAGENESAGVSLFRRRASLQSAKTTLQTAAPPAPPPKRKKRRDGTLSAMSGFLSFLLVALVAGVFGVIAALHRLKEPGPLGADKVVYFPPRSDVPEIIGQLEREGVINSPGLMNFALLIEGARSKLKPGEYQFKQQRQFARGDRRDRRGTPAHAQSHDS